MEYHDWQVAEGWGVIYGVCKCTKCGCLSSPEKMNQPTCEGRERDVPAHTGGYYPMRIIFKR